MRYQNIRIYEIRELVDLDGDLFVFDDDTRISRHALLADWKRLGGR
jgi:hypothetical protein